jgi:hypothetical protein
VRQWNAGGKEKTSKCFHVRTFGWVARSLRPHGIVNA